MKLVSSDLGMVAVSLLLLLPTNGLSVFLSSDSESYWIFIMVLVQCEVILFAAPMFALLRDVSTDGRYVGYVILIWTFPMSALGLITGPKVIAFRQGRRDTAPNWRDTRGSTLGRVHVSVITPPARPTSSLGTVRESSESPTSHLEERHHSSEDSRT